MCQYCFSNQNESYFLLHCLWSYKDISQHVMKGILTKYSIYDVLIDNDNIVFLFNNVDTYIEN